MMDAYQARVLPPHEWHRLGIPAESLPRDTDQAIIIVVENQAGDIIGRWMAYTTVVLEGLSIAPNYRYHPGVAGRLMQAMTASLVDRQVPMAMTLITDEPVARLAERHGLYQAEGKLWVLDLRRLLAASAEEAVLEEGG
jgi:hypothetical protein